MIGPLDGKHQESSTRLLSCDSGPTKTDRDRSQSATERELSLLHQVTPLTHTEQPWRIVVIPFLVQPIHRDASLLQQVVLRFASSIAVATSTANVANVHVTTCQSKRCTGVPAEDERALVALSETLTFVPVAPCKFCLNLPYFSSPGNTTAVRAPAAAAISVGASCSHTHDMRRRAVESKHLTRSRIEQ